MKNFTLAFAAILAVLSTWAPASASAAPCQAYTYCPNLGTTIYCYSYGMGCTWWVDPYRSVTCTGFDLYGVWGTFTATCF